PSPHSLRPPPPLRGYGATRFQGFVSISPKPGIGRRRIPLAVSTTISGLATEDAEFGDRPVDVRIGGGLTQPQVAAAAPGNRQRHGTDTWIVEHPSHGECQRRTAPTDEPDLAIGRAFHRQAARE